MLGKCVESHNIELKWSVVAFTTTMQATIKSVNSKIKGSIFHYSI